MYVSQLPCQKPSCNDSFLAEMDDKSKYIQVNILDQMNPHFKAGSSLPVTISSVAREQRQSKAGLQHWLRKALSAHLHIKTPFPPKCTALPCRLHAKWLECQSTFWPPEVQWEGQELSTRSGHPSEGSQRRAPESTPTEE